MANKYLSVSELRKLLGIPTDGQCTGCQFSTFHGCKDDSLRGVCEAIDDAPEANVAEVVRCKDCKYYKEGKFLGPTKFCYYYQIGTGLNTADDDFCSRGERRIENGKKIL